MDDSSAAEDLSAYLPRARYTAGIVWRSYGNILCDCMDFEDLYHEAVVAMMKVRARYKPERGVAFWSYAEYRVRGSLLDYIFGDPALPTKRANRGHHVMRFDPLPSDEYVETDEWQLLQKHREQLPFVEQRPSDTGLLNTMLARLDERELGIVYLRWYKELPLREIGIEIGLSEGRVCQLIDKILQKLKG